MPPLTYMTYITRISCIVLSITSNTTIMNILDFIFLWTQVISYLNPIGYCIGCNRGVCARREVEGKRRGGRQRWHGSQFWMWWVVPIIVLATSFDSSKPLIVKQGVLFTCHRVKALGKCGMMESSWAIVYCNFAPSCLPLPSPLMFSPMHEQLALKSFH